VLRQRRREDISIRRARRAAPHPARRTGTQTSHERASPHVSPTGLCRLQQAATRDPTATVVVSLRHAPRAHGRNSRATATGRASRGPTGRSLGAPPPDSASLATAAARVRGATNHRHRHGDAGERNWRAAGTTRRAPGTGWQGFVRGGERRGSGSGNEHIGSVGGPRAPLTDGIGGAPPPGPGR
jgi:hypothetical protein